MDLSISSGDIRQLESVRILCGKLGNGKMMMKIYIISRWKVYIGSSKCQPSIIKDSGFTSLFLHYLSTSLISFHSSHILLLLLLHEIKDPSTKNVNKSYNQPTKYRLKCHQVHLMRSLKIIINKKTYK